MIQEILQSNLFILLVSLLLVISVFITKFSAHLNTPSLIFFIIVGMSIGSGGLNLIDFHDSQVAQTIGMMALVIILFDGGTRTDWRSIRPVIVPALSLATLGVLITSCIIGLAAKVIFDISWLEAFLLGSLVGSTDAAAVFSMLSGKNIIRRVEATLEGESGVNDPMAVFLTVTFIQLVSQSDNNVWLLAGQFFWQMGGGFLIGLAIGRVASRTVNNVNLGPTGLYPLLMMAFAFLSYSISSLISASGLLAVYVSALVIGNSNLKERHTILRFNEGFSWLFQILMFVILGLFVNPGDLFSFGIILNGLLISAILIFIARPVAVFLSVAGMNYTLKEKLFFSWAGLRGAVPIVLALFPILAGVDNSQIFFNAVFFIVLTSTLIQGTTIPFAAEKLGLVGPPSQNPIKTLEILSIGRKSLDVVEYQVKENSLITQKQLNNIDFPEKALVNVILRNGETLTPTGQTVIKENDILYILIPGEEKEELEEVLRETRESS